MNDLSPVTPAEMDALFAAMPGEEARRALSFADALAAFARAADKRAAAAAMAARLAPLGYRGLSLKSLYRKLDDFRRGGVWALVPAKYRRARDAGVAANAAFLDHWRALVLENRRKLRPAWRRLVREFCAGAAVPGVGTWRDLYLREYGYLPSAGEPCPWGERDPPPGWGLSNLRRFRPDEFAVAAASRGMAAAKGRFIGKVARTRAGGLPCCRVVEVDDMWYEQKVLWGGNLEPRRVVEFAAVDVLTGHVVCRLAKPVRERADGTRETLLSAWAKYVYHYVLFVSGVPDEGCEIRGERGTARSDAELEAALEAVNRRRAAEGLGPVTFRAGGLANEPLARGLPDGAAKGNPRNKPHAEQMHATLKNEMGHVLGEVGGGRGVQPEEAGAMVREASALVALARARGVDPETVRTWFLPWAEFQRAADEAHRRMDERADHALEGWEECGFTKGQYRAKGSPHWVSCRRPAEMSPEERGAVAGLLRCGYEFREVPLSPAEAWEKSRGALRPLPGYLAPAVLGAALRCTAKVRQDLQFRYRDPNAGQEFTVEARAGGELLPRGAEYHLWVNPLDAGRAYVADTDGRYVGEARVVRAVRADAPPEELAEQLAMRRRAIADERRRLAPLARRRLEAANGRAAANLAALGLEDPAGRAALERAARAELAAAGDGAADGFEVAPPDAPGGGISDEDFASAALAAPEGGDDFPG